MQNILQLNGVIRRKDQFFLGEGRKNAGIEKILKGEVIGYTNNADSGIFQIAVDSCQVVKRVITAFFDQLVDLIKYDNLKASCLLKDIFEFLVHLIGVPAGCRDGIF